LSEARLPKENECQYVDNDGGEKQTSCTVTWMTEQ